MQKFDTRMMTLLSTNRKMTTRNKCHVLCNSRLMLTV